MTRFIRVGRTRSSGFGTSFYFECDGRLGRWDLIAREFYFLWDFVKFNEKKTRGPSNESKEEISTRTRDYGKKCAIRRTVTVNFLYRCCGLSTDRGGVREREQINEKNFPSYYERFKKYSGVVASICLSTTARRKSSSSLKEKIINKNRRKRNERNYIGEI